MGTEAGWGKGFGPSMILDPQKLFWTPIFWVPWDPPPPLVGPGRTPPGLRKKPDPSPLLVTASTGEGCPVNPPI